MNSQLPTPEQPDLSYEELQDLIREDAPLTRRQIRMRDRAEEAGQLVRVDGALVIAEEAVAQSEPPAVTSADVLAGNVSAATGLTRRQLRELLAQEQQGEEPSESEPHLEEAEPEEPQPGEDDEHPDSEQTMALRPIVHPEGAQTGEYTGQFDEIRQAATDPVPTPIPEPIESSEPSVPERRSIFDAPIEQTFDEPQAEDFPSNTDTNASDLPSLFDDDGNQVQANFFTEDVGAPEDSDSGQGEDEAGEPPLPAVPRPGDETYNFPDWHTLTEIPAVQEPAPQSIDSTEETLDRRGRRSTLERDDSRADIKRKSPLWLTILQWCVIAAVAVVLGLLVWYAINKGFNTGEADAVGMDHPLYYLRM